MPARRDGVFDECSIRGLTGRYNSGMFDDAVIAEAARRLSEAAPQARVILFGSAARGQLRKDSDLDFLVIEPEVDNCVAEAVRLRDAVGRVGGPVDVIVIDAQLAARRAKVRGTMVHHALREGQVLAGSEL
jgi:predicted nucleotidyltransferase